MKRPMTAVVLAGGSSSRMGQNKALMNLGEKRMIERVVEPLKEIFQEIITVTNTPKEYGFLKGIRLIPDVLEGDGRNSLVGIYSGLMAASFSEVFIVACDMPFINKSLIEYMIKAKDEGDIIIPYTDPHYEPLHAIYHTNCIFVIRQAIENQDFKIVNILKRLEIRPVLKEEILKFDSLMKCFINVNTYEEYETICNEF